MFCGQVVIHEMVLPPLRPSRSRAKAGSGPPRKSLRRLRREGTRNARRAEISNTSSTVHSRLSTMNSGGLLRS